LDSARVAEQRGFIEYGKLGHVRDLVGHAARRPSVWKNVVVQKGVDLKHDLLREILFDGRGVWRSVGKEREMCNIYYLGGVGSGIVIGHTGITHKRLMPFVRTRMGVPRSVIVCMSRL
jgi:hypothetical protein